MTQLAPLISSPTASPPEMALVIFSAADCLWRDDGDGPVTAAREPVRWLVSREVPLVLVSCRPAADVIGFQRQLGFRHPFVCERGKTLFVPDGYFPDVTQLGTTRDGWNIVEFNPAHDACQAVRLLASLYRLCASEVVFVGLSGDCHQAAQLRALPCEYLSAITCAEAWSETILGPRVE